MTVGHEVALAGCGRGNARRQSLSSSVGSIEREAALQRLKSR
jgi:hypothetical protein